MTTTTGWIIAAVLVLVGLGLIVWVGKSRRRPDDSAPVQEAPVERVAARSEPPAEPIAAPAPVAAPVAPTVAAAPVPAPAVPRPASPPPAPPPPPKSPPPPPAAPPPAVSLVPPTVIIVPPPRPAAPVIERVLALEPAGEGEWAAGIALPLSPVQSASVATALAGEELTAVYAIDFAPGATMAVARADLAFMRSLAAGAASTSTGRWLDGSAAAVVAAVSIAGLANERFLESLGDEMRELKSLLAALSPKIDGMADGRLKALVQDLSRFAREARENYASAIGKAAFRERIEDAAERALNIWRDAVERTDAARQPLEPLSRAPRFGEVQVEKALALMRALQEQKRIQEVSARTLGAANTLRVAVGDSVVATPVDPLASAAAALQGGIEQDREMFARLVDCEKAARGDPYVGKGEFEANRAALRKLVERPAAEPFTVTLERIAATQGAEPLDPPRGSPRRLLLRTGAEGAAMRLSAG